MEGQATLILPPTALHARVHYSTPSAPSIIRDDERSGQERARWWGCSQCSVHQLLVGVNKNYRRSSSQNKKEQQEDPDEKKKAMHKTNPVIWNNCTRRRLKVETPPLFSLWQCQSQAWIKEEGKANGLCYHTASLNCNNYWKWRVIMSYLSYNLLFSDTMWPQYLRVKILCNDKNIMSFHWLYIGSR